MGSCVQFRWIVFFLTVLINATAQTICQSSSTSKKDPGSECNVGADCITNYCINKTCDCQLGDFFDKCSHTCIKNCNNTLHYTKSSNLTTGLIVSADVVNPPGTKCLWEIFGWSGSYLTLIIDFIDMNPCESDNNWVEVVSTRALLLYRGESLKYFTKTMATEYSWLRVYYSTTFAGYKGFRASYYINDYNSVLTSTSGYIVSPGFPIFYDENRNFTWLISGNSGQIVTLRFLNISFDCPRDFLNIYDGNSIQQTPLATVCDRGKTFNITSTTSNLLIHFQTDNIDSGGKGFAAYYFIHGKDGDRCTSSDRCPIGFTCNDALKFDCLKRENYSTYNTCRRECCQESSTISSTREISFQTTVPNTSTVSSSSEKSFNAFLSVADVGWSLFLVSVIILA